MKITLALAFLTGFVVMQIEVVAPRILAPHFGATHLTWSAVFAVFLGMLALGNLLGGRLADRGGRRLPVLCFGLAALTIPLLLGMEAWVRGGAYEGYPPALRTFVATFLLFAPAAFVLGLVGPVLARAALAAGGRPGRALGAVAGVTAAGSLSGTLCTGLIALPVSTIKLAAAALLVVGGVLAWRLPVQRPQREAATSEGRPWRWMGLAALSGAALLIVEVAAGRIAARQVGTSLYTWTSVIGTVLCALALGNFVGGRLAEREDRTRTIGLLLVFASACVAACLWTPRLLPVLAGPEHAGTMWPWRVFLATIVSFGLPAFAFGLLGPVVLRAALRDPAHDGRVAGHIYAAGTVGAVAGSLLAGYVLVPWLGTTPLFVLLAFVFALLAGRLQQRYEFAWLATLLVVGVLVFAPLETVAQWGRRLGLREDAPDVVVRHSKYFHIAIEPHTQRWSPVVDMTMPARYPDFDGRLSYDPQRKALHWDGPMTEAERDAIADALGVPRDTRTITFLHERANTRMRRLLLDGFVHGFVDLDHPGWLEYDYEMLYAAVTRALRPKELRLSCFFIGGGCYTSQRRLLSSGSYPRRFVTAEIDPVVTSMAREHLDLQSYDQHEIHHDDARVVLRASADTFDFVFGDAFHDLAVPWHLATCEFAELVKSRLNPTGAYLVNLIDIYNEGHFLRAFVDTLREVFPHVRVLSMAPRDDDAQTTFLLVASPQAVQLGTLEGLAGDLDVVEYGAADLAALRARTEAVILRDDFAPVEHLLAPVIRRRGGARSR